MKVRKLGIGLCIILLALLFTYTVSIKVFEYDKFLFQLRLSPLSFIVFLAPVLAWLIPLFAAVIIVLLLTPGWSYMGLRAALILLLLFELYIVLVLVSGLPLPCQCSGLDNKLTWYGHLYVNAGFMAVAGIGLRGLTNKWPFRA